MSSKGQITIPKHVRDALGIEPGDALEFEVRGHEFVGRKKVLAGGLVPIRWHSCGWSLDGRNNA